jgi:hypothetical protein
VTEESRIWDPLPWRGRSEQVGQWWKLTKGNRIVTCDLYTHPLGGELWCEIDGEMFATHAARKLDELLDASDRWKAAFKLKEWTE